VAITSLYLVAAIVLMLEAVCMVFWWRNPRIRYKRGFVQGHWGDRLQMPLPKHRLDTLILEDAQSLPKCSIIVVAYLPNEQDIILETLEHILQTVIRPVGGLEVILAYNTPQSLPVEAELWELAYQYPELRLLLVKDSHSKAENLNRALELVTGEMTCIFDSDHLPAADCLIRAWAWLEQGAYDVVQGRSIIRNRQENWVTRWIGTEFDCLYGVSHPGRSLLSNAALFGGSNGYWRTTALQNIGFQVGMLTEDIDATLRCLRAGIKIVNDPEIFSYELAPCDLRGFWSQRQRWAQGWLDVAHRYRFNLPFWSTLDLGQKICWLIILLYSSLFHWVAIQAIVLMVHNLIWPSPLPDWFWLYACSVSVLSLFSNYLQAIIANGRSLWQKEALFYTLVSPFFFGIKTLIVFVALYNVIQGRRQWVVTRRSSATSSKKKVLASLSKLS
jgi:cellulose synthase/poly-beta-1,6-N-acetylglucosamine synthase-like glycosyltransferase